MSLHASPANVRNIRGLSLIELMIAMLIGLVLILGLVQVFAASRTSYQLSEGLARVQENGRFAIDFLQRDVRMAGHFGCVNDQAHARQNPSGLGTTFGAAPPSALRFGESIEGYEATGTAPNAAGIALPETPTTGGTTYTPALPADIAAATANRVPNSDIIVLRYLAPESVPVTVIGGTANSPTFTFDKDRWDILRSGVDNPSLFGISDCMNAMVFQASAIVENGTTRTVTAGEGAPANESNPDKVFTAGQAMLSRAESIVYYVGLDPNTRRPALYRTRFSAAPNLAVASDSQPMVDGIESLQLLYGQDRQLDPALSPTGYIERIGDAATVAASRPVAADAWRRVGSVQIGLVAVSPERASSLQSQAPISAMGVSFNAPNDGRYRTVYETTVALRNRLYGN
jgi:type IV pilus assembly protein PilW